MKIEDNTIKEKDTIAQAVVENTPVLIPKEDYINFYKTVILSNENFIKSYKIEDSVLKFRTRSSEESDYIIKEVLKAQKEDVVWASKLMNDLNLACSLYSFANDDYHSLSICDKLEIIHKFPTPKASILFTYLGEFEKYIAELMKKYENF